MKLAVVLGTRPEIIKLSPLVNELKSRGIFSLRVIFTGQHRSMAEQAFTSFGVKPDEQLDLMTPDQTPTSFLGACLPRLEQSLKAFAPDYVLVQGDTSTALAGALAAFHLKIPVAHVEAGLRTGHMYSPFPEEMNRILISRMASLHFCHTEHARKNLTQEGIAENSFVVGNTVVDALLQISNKLECGEILPSSAVASLQLGGKSMVLVTGHRRENFDEPLQNLCGVLKALVSEVPDVDVVYPVHLNPKVQGTVHKLLGTEHRIHLIAPVDYPSFVYLMKKSSLIISDSGGVQEEAPSLGKKVLVTREHTERPEAGWAGCSEVFPLSEPEKLLTRARAVLAGQAAEAPSVNPYGDGTTSKQIADVFERLGSAAS